MTIILNVKVTGSAEIVVTAGSSTDDGVVIADYLGYTIGDALKRLEARGYRLSFVTEKFFVCTKNTAAFPTTTGKQTTLTLFSPIVEF